MYEKENTCKKPSLDSRIADAKKRSDEEYRLRKKSETKPDEGVGRRERERVR